MSISRPAESPVRHERSKQTLDGRLADELQEKIANSAEPPMIRDAGFTLARIFLQAVVKLGSATAQRQTRSR
jgi:hypothetical protein